MWCVLRALPLAGGTRETRGTFSSFEMPWLDPASIEGNTWLSALALRILVGEGLWAVRIARLGEQRWSFRHCFAHCHKGGALFCEWIGNAGQQHLLRALPISGIHCPTRLTRRTRPTCSLQVAKLRALHSTLLRTIQSAKPLYGRKNAPALNRRDGLLPARPKMGFCASWREAPAVVLRFGCQKSSWLSSLLPADFKARSTFQSERSL